MEEKKIKDIALNIAQTVNKEFSENALLPKWNSYSAVSKFKSIKRAIRRGHVDLLFGVVYPNKPFNNRRLTNGRSHNQLKKRLYEQLK